MNKLNHAAFAAADYDPENPTKASTRALKTSVCLGCEIFQLGGDERKSCEIEYDKCVGFPHIKGCDAYESTERRKGNDLTTQALSIETSQTLSELLNANDGAWATLELEYDKKVEVLAFKTLSFQSPPPPPPSK